MTDYQTIYNKFYNEHGADVHDDPLRFGAIAKLCRGNVLDIGCGTGDLSHYILSPYLGIDVSDVAIKMARENGRSDAEFEVADLTIGKLNLVEKFDTIVMAQFLEHIPADEFDINNIIERVADGGRIVVSVPNGNRIPDKNHVQEFTIPKLRKMFSKYGNVKFYNWPGAEKRILMSCDVGVQVKKDLSLCMVLKNEAVGLESAVMSAIEIVDEVIILVDMDSKDETLEIARNLGDVVKTFKWQDDFSWARNLANEQATCKWILTLDGHEWIKKVGPLDKFIDSGFDGLFCRVEDAKGLVFRTPRIAKRGVEWKDAVHNKIQVKNPNDATVLVIGHDISGRRTKEFAKERETQRKEMNEKSLLERIENNKNDTRAMFYLAGHYMTYGGTKKAVKLYKKYLKISEHGNERWFVCFNLAVAYLGLKKPRRAFYYAQRTERETPGRWENKYICGVILLNNGRPEASLEYFVECFEPNKVGYTFSPIPFSPSEIWDLMGNAFFKLNQFDKAKAAWFKAIENSKDENRIAFFKQREQLLNMLINKK